MSLYMLAADTFIGAQVQTAAVPLGVLLIGLLWLFFQRRPTR